MKIDPTQLVAMETTIDNIQHHHDTDDIQYVDEATEKPQMYASVQQMVDMLEMAVMEEATMSALMPHAPDGFKFVNDDGSTAYEVKPADYQGVTGADLQRVLTKARSLRDCFA